jgi:hypothetical protein
VCESCEFKWGYGTAGKKVRVYRQASTRRRGVVKPARRQASIRIGENEAGYLEAKHSWKKGMEVDERKVSDPGYQDLKRSR